MKRELDHIMSVTCWALSTYYSNIACSCGPYSDVIGAVVGSNLAMVMFMASILKTRDVVFHVVSITFGVEADSLLLTQPRVSCASYSTDICLTMKKFRYPSAALRI